MADTDDDVQVPANDDQNDLGETPYDIGYIYVDNNTIADEYEEVENEEVLEDGEQKPKLAIPAEDSEQASEGEDDYFLKNANWDSDDPDNY